MSENASVDRLWARFTRENVGVPARPNAVFHFCDNQEDADLCADLVRRGVKRATASSLAELAIAGDPVPRVGDLNVVIDWAGEAQAVVRTTSVNIRRLGDVDAAFARDEGEGDGSLAWWREAHNTYYGRVLAGSGLVVDDDLMICCERFEVVMLGVKVGWLHALPLNFAHLRLRRHERGGLDRAQENPPGGTPAGEPRLRCLDQPRWLIAT